MFWPIADLRTPKRFSKHETVYNVGMLKGLGRTHLRRPPKLVVTEERRTAGKLASGACAARGAHPGGFAARRWRTEREACRPYEAAGSVSFTGSARGRAFSCVVSQVRFRRECHSAGRDIYGINAVIVESNAVGRHRTRTSPQRVVCRISASLIPDENNLPARWQPLEQVSSCAQSSDL